MNEEVTHQLTLDGSSTLYNPVVGECYHSHHGALQESMHVFIDMGLRGVPQEKKEISILEMGLGTGLNALLTMIHQDKKEIRYTGIEAFPLSEKAIETLNYVEQAGGGDFFEKIHAADWGKSTEITPGFHLQKIHTQLQDFETEDRFDLIYFDAFGPEKQPELWTDEVFEKIASLANPGAIFVTYSSRGVARRSLIAAGFDMERIPGPPGKRHMLRGKKRELE